MMKSDFLNLPSSASGDARRHVPFRSIIHKPLSIIFVLVFVFSIIFSYRTSVSALAAPELNPVYNTDIIQIEEYVNGLSSGQMDVFNILLGFYLASQAGAAKYQIEDSYVDQSGVLNWLKSCGVKFYNDFAGWLGGYDPVYGIDKDKFLAILMGAAVLADQYTDQADFVSDIENSNNYFVPFDKSLQIGLNQFFASFGGLYNWQLRSIGIDELQNFIWNNNGASSSTIESILEHVGSSGVRCNNPNQPRFSALFGYRSSKPFNEYHNIFINTYSHNVSVYDDYGNSFSSGVMDVFGVNDTWSYGLILSPSWEFTFIINSLSYSYNSSLTNVKDILEDYFNHINSNALYPAFSDFIVNIYAGVDWAGRQPVTISDTLNFNDSDSISYDQVQTDLLLDIKGLLQDLIDTNELREPVFDNLYDPSGQPVSDPATVNVSVNAILPESGIDIPSNLFSPLTKEGGYISYLWYMTKPLVQYTSDLVQTLVFPDDTGEGFDVTGPGAIVFGVISFGLIGGLIVKCLL